MDIDDRINRLTERHEALAQSVELLVAQGIETRKMLEETNATVKDTSAAVKEVSATVRELSATVRELSTSVRELSTSVRELSTTVDVISHGVLDLLGIVRVHETRLVRLEDRAA